MTWRLTGGGKVLWIALAALCLALPAVGKTLYVAPPGQSTPVFPYATTNTAASSIQVAVNAALDGDTVMVLPGTYYLTTEVIIKEKGVTVRSRDGRGATVVDAQGLTRGFYINHVLASVEGFTIRNGVATPNPAHGDSYGGGVYIEDGGSVRDCIIEDCSAKYGGGVRIRFLGSVENSILRRNTASISGGGIQTAFGGTVSGVTLHGNTAVDKGGGIYLFDGGEMTDSVIYDNQAWYGGGVRLYFSSVARPKISRSRIYGNRAIRRGSNLGAGGGVQIELGGTVENCLVHDNEADAYGGGVHIYQTGGSVPALMNTTISHNRTKDTTGDGTGNGRGGGLFTSGGGLIVNSIIYYNQSALLPNRNTDDSAAAYRNSLTAPSLIGNGNLFAQVPQFVDPDTRNYYLLPGSPCIDKGTNTGAPLEDFAGTLRPLSGSATNTVRMTDIGAYEYFEADDIDQDGMPTWWELHFGLNPNNPADAVLDPDDDGLTNLQEYQVSEYYLGIGFDPAAGLDPFNPDTDGDGLLDGQEAGPDAGIPNGGFFTSLYGVVETNPLETDTDGDGFSDLYERDNDTDPSDPDSYPTSVSGTITYSGTLQTNGPVHIRIEGPPGMAPRTAVIPGLGAYTVTNVPTKLPLVITAYRDGTVPIGTVGVRDPWEPVGAFTGNPLTFSGLQSGVHIVLHDPVTDTDGDGLSDYEELFIYGTNPNNPDTDNDGMPDGWEVHFMPALNPLVADGTADFDGDGLTNVQEYQYSLVTLGPGFNPADGLDPTNPDTDGDGMLDGWEVHFGLDPLDPANAERQEDIDTFGMTNLDKYRFSTNYFGGTAFNPANGLNPNALDTDGDGMPDAWEVHFWPGRHPITQLPLSPDPLVADAIGDPDFDDLTNLEEYEFSVAYFGGPAFEPADGLDPTHPDSDGDGMPDGWEVRNGLDPLDPADRDGDADEDGLTNYEEFQWPPNAAFPGGLDPTHPDTDGDGVSDGDEVIAGTDPLDPDSYPVRISGIIDYSGIQTGMIHVVASRQPFGQVYTITMPGPGAYEFPNVANATHYLIEAYMDSNANALQEFWEASGVLSDTNGLPLILYPTNALTTGMDFTLEDPDSDGDGIIDLLEVTWSCYASGMVTRVEWLAGAGDPSHYDPYHPLDNPTGTDLNHALADTDGDGMPDGWETYFWPALNPLADDAGGDYDDDDLTNLQEYNLSLARFGAGFDPADGLDPAEWDTDEDGFSDGDEVLLWGTDPLDGASFPVELTGTLFNATAAPQTGMVYVVLNLESNANHFATFGVGTMTNGAPLPFSIQYVPNQTSYWISAFMDLEGDAGQDTWDPHGVAMGGTVPIEAVTNLFAGGITLEDSLRDSDEDGLTDYDERFIHFTSPFDADTDGDGFNDYDEIFVYGTDPLDGNSFPAFISGTVSYTNGHPGTLLVVVSNDTQTVVYDFGEFSDGVYSTPTNLPTLTNYAVMAFIDSNTNGVLDRWEARGAPVGSPFFLTGNIPDADILLAHTTADFDEDGLSDYEEYYIYGTDPEDPDTDGDGFSDYDEIFVHGTDPLDPDSFPVTISGQVLYTPGPVGAQTGTVYVTATDTQDGSIVYTVTLAGPGAYAITNMPTLRSYDVSAYLDDNGNGVLDSTWEAQGAYALNPVSPTGVVTGVDVAMAHALATDSDNDGITDYNEVYVWGSGPLDADTSDDGVPDGWLAHFGLHPVTNWTGVTLTGADMSVPVKYAYSESVLAPGWNVADGLGFDPDDGLDPTVLDTDEDGVGDGEEITWGSDPLDPDSFPITISGMIGNATAAPQTGTVYVVLNLESNANHFATFEVGDITNGLPLPFTIGYVPNHTEFWISAFMDLDGNGAYDPWDPYGAAFNGTNSVTPTNNVNVGLLPLTDSLADSDGDGLTDYDEHFIHGTDPGNPDTDGDGFSDYDEIFVYGTDPLDGNSFPAFISGTVTYTGIRPGTLLVVVSNDAQTVVYDFGEYSDGIYSTPTNLPTLTNYAVMAFIDSNTNGVLDLWEARGEPAGTPFWLAGNITDADILLAHTTADFDEDGLSDYEEYFIYGTDPENPDSDGDGMPDGWEVENGLDPLDDTGENGANGDPDGDGLRNYLEYLYGTDPQDPDSDGDGLSDLLEVTWSCFASGMITRQQWLDGAGDPDHYDPYHPVDNPTGTDLDALRADTDDDGIPDGWEAHFWPVTNPLLEDADEDPDGDDLTNIDEYDFSVDYFGTADFAPEDGLDPGNPDSDGDLLPDGDEVLIHGTDPLEPDTDGDGFTDYDEIVNIGSDPLNMFDPIVVDDDAPNDPVPGDPNHLYPEENGSLEYPFDSIQEGVLAALDGDTVLVMDGEYKSTGNYNINTMGKAITIRSRNGYAVTDILTDIGNGFIVNSGEGAGTVIEGFTIRTSVEDLGSAGILVDGSSPVIRECRFFDCGEAGVLVRDEGRPHILDCLFEENQGAIKVQGSHPRIERSTIRFNADEFGGGLWITGTSAVTSQPFIVNCLIVRNRATDTGGGVYAGAHTRAVLINTTIAHNEADVRGGGIYNAGDTKFWNGILWTNTAPVGPGFALDRAFETSYSCMQTPRPTSIGVFVADPRFAGPNDYSLLSSSPCIDAGTVNIPYTNAPVDDIRGLPRPQSVFSFPGYDVGAYEYQPGGAIYLQSPGGGVGEVFESGLPLAITWAYEDDVTVGTNLLLEYTYHFLTDPSIVWSPLASDVYRGTGGTGSYTWTAPVTNASRVYLRVSDATNSLIAGFSTFEFGLTNGVRVFAPVEGSTYYLGQTAAVSWASSPATNTTAQLALSTDGGSFEPGDGAIVTNAAHVAGGATNTLSWVFEARDATVLTTNGQVRVSSGGLRSGLSGGDLSILGLVVTIPGPGGTVQTGATHNVRWTGLGAGAAVDIRYSDNGGGSFTVVSNGVANVDGTNAFVWLVPAVVTTNAVLEVTSVSDPNIRGWTWFEVSDAGGSSINLSGDGIPDSWKIAYGLDPANLDGQSGADDDPDGDGVSNYHEWLAGTDPLNGTSFLGILALDPLAPGAKGALGTSETAAFVLRWQSVPGRRYVVEVASAPGGPWSDASDALEASGTELLWMDAMLPVQRFYRIRVLVD